MKKILSEIVKDVESSLLKSNVRLQVRAQDYGLMGTARLDMARRFEAPGKGWEAPPRRVGTFRENLKGMVQNAVTNAFLPLTRQYDELNKAEAMLADSPTGKALMDTSEKGHVLTRLDT